MGAEEKGMKREIIIGAIIILAFFVPVVILGESGFFEPKEKKVDVVVDSELELQEVCNQLVVNNEVYPFLEVMGNGLRKENDAQFVTYKFPAELRSDLEIFNVDGLILCGVPAELCYTENDDIKGGSYCLNWLLEVPVFINDFSEWYQKSIS